jgi:hypothetical protein
MKFPQDKLDTLRGWVTELDTEAVRDSYRRGEFPRADKCKDVDRRYRWDLLWASLHRNDTDHAWRGFMSDLADAHIDTALRNIVAPLAT